jgi:predicted alpha/beta hydrolase family esterase
MHHGCEYGGLAVLGEYVLQDFVLVGHSGGSPVARHAAERIAQQMRRIILVTNEDADQTVAIDPWAWAEHLMKGASPNLTVVVDALVLRFIMERT